MTKETLEEWLRTGRDLEFRYKGRHYSITHFIEEDGTPVIAFSDFYDYIMDVKDAESLWNATYNDLKVKDILEGVPEYEVHLR